MSSSEPRPSGSPSVLEALQRLRLARVIAVVRSDDAEEAVALAEALVEGGIGAVELTFTTPGVGCALVEARRRLAGRALLGAGTITSTEQLAAATAAEADFLVSPYVDVPLLEAMIASGRLAVPGALTPSEVATAVRAGASVVKLFPASTVGVRHLKALLGPFPGLQVIPTGGISPAAVHEWLSAGALAVGIGGELLPEGLVRARAWGEIADRVSEVLTALTREES
jgi:2-dehydro-3-deoxyphosphogluconate aldolase / (4S)-4-hydroxy-2-oxoglutarate aldolase